MHWDASFLYGGSISHAVLGLATGQASLGAEVAIATASPSGPPLYGPIDVSDGMTILEWQPRWTLRFDGFLLRGIPPSAHRRLRAFKPDVVHVHGGFNGDNLWVPRLFGCPIVFSPHGAYFSEVFMKSRSVAKTLYLHVERRVLHQRVTAVHALSPIERMQVSRFLPGRPVYCLPQGAGNNVPPTMAQEAFERPTREVTFVFVGRLDVFHKGLDLLLTAFAHAEKRVDGRRIRLALVGPDWRGGKDWLDQRGRELGIGDRVDFLGAVSGPQVISILSRSHIYIQVSRYDAFPLSVAEALLAGKPAILSSAVGQASYPEIASLPHVRVVPVGVTETADAMVDFVRRLDELAIAARQHRTDVHNFFSWEKNAQAHLVMYEKIRKGL